MPIYVFEHPKTGKQKEIIQTVNEEHIYIDGKGVQWNRVYTVPQVAVDPLSKVNPFSAQEFVDVTSRKKGSVGSLLEFSKELSERRGGEEHDPILKKRNADYKKRNGVEHVSEKRLRSKKKLKAMGIQIS